MTANPISHRPTTEAPRCQYIVRCLHRQSFFLSTNNYLSPTKLQEGNVFSDVRLSFCSRGEGGSDVTIIHDSLHLTIQGPLPCPCLGHRNSLTPSLGPNLSLSPPPPTDIGPHYACTPSDIFECVQPGPPCTGTPPAYSNSNIMDDVRLASGHLAFYCNAIFIAWFFSNVYLIYFAGLTFFALCLFAGITFFALFICRHNFLYLVFICRDNFLNVDVYFAQLKYQSVMQIKAYDLVQFMGMHSQSY